MPKTVNIDQRSATERTGGINLMIEPTNRCNLRCVTCFSHQDGRKKRDMSLREFTYIIDHGTSVIKNVALYNYGEPLLNKDLWKMIFYAKKKGVRSVKVSTNGILLGRAAIQRLLASGLDKISISVDGITDRTYGKFRVGGDFKRLIRNIASLVTQRDRVKSSLIIELQCIITKYTEKDIPRMEDFARTLGVDELRLKTLLVQREQWKFLLPRDAAYSRYTGISKSSGCSKPLRELVVTSDGTVIPCCYVVGGAIPRLALGNAFVEPLPQIISGQRYRVFIDQCSTRRKRMFYCSACSESEAPLTYKTIPIR